MNWYWVARMFGWLGEKAALVALVLVVGLHTLLRLATHFVASIATWLAEVLETAIARESGTAPKAGPRPDQSPRPVVVAGQVVVK